MLLMPVITGGAIEQVWDLPGVEVPHDLEVVAAPVWAGAGKQRPVALMVTETRMQDSRLLKFILLPNGGQLAAPELHQLCSAPVPMHPAPDNFRMILATSQPEIALPDLHREPSHLDSDVVMQLL